MRLLGNVFSCVLQRQRIKNFSFNFFLSHMECSGINFFGTLCFLLQGQYIYIHKLLAEIHTFGTTEVDVSEFISYEASQMKR